VERHEGAERFLIPESKCKCLREKGNGRSHPPFCRYRKEGKGVHALAQVCFRSVRERMYVGVRPEKKMPKAVALRGVRGGCSFIGGKGRINTDVSGTEG